MGDDEKYDEDNQKALEVEVVNALCFHTEYNPKTGLCKDGWDWCGECPYEGLIPQPSLGAAFLAPAYAVSRVAYFLFMVIPWLFGFRHRVIIQNGKARSRLVRRG